MVPTIWIQDTTRRWRTWTWWICTKTNFQDIQEFWDQYKAMTKGCDNLELKFSRCKSDAKAILKEKGLTSPTIAQHKRQLMRSKRSITQFYSCTCLTELDMEIYRNKWRMICCSKKTMALLEWVWWRGDHHDDKQELIKIPSDEWR